MFSTVRERSGSTARERADEGQRLGLRVVVRPRHVVELAVGDVLQAAGDPRCAVVLHVRHVDDLGEGIADHPDQVGPGILFSEEIGLHVDVRIEAQPRARRFDTHAGGHELVVLRQQDLPASPFVDDDVVGSHADLDQVRHNLRHDLGHRHGARRTGRIHLDADEVLRIEEPRPAVPRILVPRQRRHAAGDHRLHGRHVDLFSGLVYTARRVDGDHAPRVWTGDAGPGRRLVRRHDRVARNRPRLQRGHSRHGRHRGHELSTIHRGQRRHRLQKKYLATSWTMRASLTVLVIVPKAVLWMFTFGGPKFGWFRALKASTRNSR